ncbi:hypothetical protein AB6A40_000148 [Gnathostoma spinigerum]|uniref:Uncharacterized protein n=1 Tax=Gnathostoma spinigerum TaxID=75299 RepID=A0ABD6E1H1_9BILA
MRISFMNYIQRRGRHTTSNNGNERVRRSLFPTRALCPFPPKRPFPFANTHLSGFNPSHFNRLCMDVLPSITVKLYSDSPAPPPHPSYDTRIHPVTCLLLSLGNKTPATPLLPHRTHSTSSSFIARTSMRFFPSLILPSLTSSNPSYSKSATPRDMPNCPPPSPLVCPLEVHTPGVLVDLRVA